MIARWLEKIMQSRQQRAVVRHKKNIKRKFGQGEDRYKAVEFFKSLGGEAGCEGLLERFMVNVEPSIRDEEEKEQVFNELVRLGAVAIPAIEKYLNRKDAASVPVMWPLKVLAAVATPEQAVAVIKRTLEAMGASYVREPERKVLLVGQLAEYDTPEVVPTLIPFLRDHRDEVQLEALAALARKADERAREPMLELLIDPNTPARVRAAIADALQKLGWPVRGHRKSVEEALPEGFSVDRSGRIKGRWIYAPAQPGNDQEG